MRKVWELRLQTWYLGQYKGALFIELYHAFLSAANQQTNSVELPMSSPSMTSEDWFTPCTYPTHRLLVTGTADVDTDRYLDSIAGGEIGIDFHPLPRQLVSAEVHIPGPSSPLEVVSTSVRVSGDNFPTPKSSLVDPSPLAVATDTSSHTLPNPSFCPTHNSAVRVTKSLPRSLQLPLGPKNVIVLSSDMSSSASSCDGDESELTSDDSEMPPMKYLAPVRPQWRGSAEYLAPGTRYVSRSQSASPTPRESPADYYSEDDTVLVTRRRVEKQQQRSFFNLSPSPSMEVIEFSTPLTTGSSLGRSASMRLSRERNPPLITNSSHNTPLSIATVSRTVPLSAITHTQSVIVTNFSLFY